MDINSTNKTALAASISIALAKARIALEKAVRRWPAGSANGLGGQFMPSNAAPGAGMLRGPRAKPRSGRQEVSANEPPPSPPVRLRGFSEAAGLPSRPDVSRWSPTHSTARSVMNRINLLERYALDGDVASIQGMSTTRTNNYYRQLDNYRNSLLQHFEPAARIARLRGAMPEPVVLTGTNMANTALTSAQRHINRLTSIARESANPLEDLRNYTLGGGGPRTNTYLRRAQGYHAALVAHFSQGESAASAPLGQQTQTSSSTTETRTTQRRGAARNSNASLVKDIFSSAMRYSDDISDLKRQGIQELSDPARLADYSASFREKIAQGVSISDLIGKNIYDADLAKLASNLTVRQRLEADESLGAKILVALSAKATIADLYRKAQESPLLYLFQRQKTVAALEALNVAPELHRRLDAMNHNEFMQMMQSNPVARRAGESVNPEVLGLRRDKVRLYLGPAAGNVSAPVYLPHINSDFAGNPEGALLRHLRQSVAPGGGNYRYELFSTVVNDDNRQLFGEFTSAVTGGPSGPLTVNGFRFHPRRSTNYVARRGEPRTAVEQRASADRSMMHMLAAMNDDFSDTLAVDLRTYLQGVNTGSMAISDLRNAVNRGLTLDVIFNHSVALSHVARTLIGGDSRSQVVAHDIQYALTASKAMSSIASLAGRIQLRMHSARSGVERQRIYADWERAKGEVVKNLRGISAVNLANYLDSAGFNELAIASARVSYARRPNAINGISNDDNVGIPFYVDAREIDAIGDRFSRTYPLKVVTSFPNSWDSASAESNHPSGMVGAAREIDLWATVMGLPREATNRLMTFRDGVAVDISTSQTSTTSAPRSAASSQPLSSGFAHRDFSGTQYRSQLGSSETFVFSSGHSVTERAQNRVVNGIQIEGTSSDETGVRVTLSDITRSSVAANPQGLSVNDLGFIPRPDVPLNTRVRVDNGVAYAGSERITNPALAALAIAYMAQDTSLQSRAREYQQGNWVPDTPEARARRQQQLAEQAARQAAEAERQRIEREQQEVQLRERLRDSITHEANIRSSLPEHWKPQSTIGANVTSFGDATRNLSSSFASATMLTAEGREKFAKSLIADFGNNEKFDVSVTGRDTSVNFSFTGNKGTSMSRTVSVDANGKVGVYHGYFRAGQRGAGAGKRFFRVAMGEYKAIGVSTVKVGANLDVGGYAWARFGYLPTDWRGIAGTIASKATSLFRQRSITAEVHSQISSICQDSDPKGLWKIADMDIGGRKIGKELLLGTSWGGVINLNNREQIERFSAYTAHG